MCRRDLSCWRRISTIFLWGETLLKRSCKVLRVWMYSSELTVRRRGIMSTKNTTYVSQKTVAMTSHIEWVALNVFRGEVAWCDSTGCPFVCGFKVMDPCFNSSDDPWQAAFTITVLTEQQIWTHLFPHSFMVVGWAAWNPKSTNIWILCGIKNVTDTLPLDTDSLVESLLVVMSVFSNVFISILKQRLSDCCWPARATRVTQPRLAFLRTCNSWSPTSCAFTNSIGIVHISLTACKFSLLITPLP